MADKKKDPNEGVEFPPDFNETKAEEKTEATKEQKIEAAKEMIAKVENKEVVKTIPPVVPPTTPAVITRANVVKWEDALRALPTSFTELNVESKRATIELGFAAQIIRNSEWLKKCDPKSIYDAVIYSARIGITLNPALGLCYLVPRDGKCCLDVGYKGWRAVLVTYGGIQHIDGYVVYEDEVKAGQFTWNPSNDELHHVPIFAKTEQEHKERKVYCAYSKAILPSGHNVYEVIEAWELNKIKNVSPAVAKGGYSPYTNWDREMTRKAPIKRHAKKLHVLQNDDRISAMFENEKRNDEMAQVKKKTAQRWDVETEFEEVK